MPHQNPLTRRLFLQSAGLASSELFWKTGAVALAAIARDAAAAQSSAAGFTVLGADDARDLAAMAARIIPTTDTPGATEAGVIHFFDRAFATEMADSREFALEELATLNRGLDGRFADLDTAAQDRALHAIETGSFFELVRVMTIFGFFAMSSYGGNRDQIGWQLIGFDGHHGPWSYPFGYYDAAAAGESGDGD